MEFCNHIWNHHEKCIQLSTNIPGIGSLIGEIAVKFWESETDLRPVKLISEFKVLKVNDGYGKQVNKGQCY